MSGRQEELSLMGGIFFYNHTYSTRSSTWNGPAANLQSLRLENLSLRVAWLVGNASSTESVSWVSVSVFLFFTDISRCAVFSREVHPQFKRRPAQPCPSIDVTIALGILIGSGSDFARRLNERRVWHVEQFNVFQHWRNISTVPGRSKRKSMASRKK